MVNGWGCFFYRLTIWKRVVPKAKGVVPKTKRVVPRTKRVVPRTKRVVPKAKVAVFLGPHPQPISLIFRQAQYPKGEG